MDRQKLYNYADLVMKVGLRVKEGDRVSISSSVDQSEFAEILVEAAYKNGARHARVDFADAKITKLNLQYQTTEDLKEINQYFVDHRESMLDDHYKFVSITGGDPKVFEGTDPEKFAVMTQAGAEAMKKISARMMANDCSWCVVGAANKDWAKVIYPDLDENEAVEKLWDLILYTVRADLENPIKEWEDHMNRLTKRAEWLNSKNFDYLEYKTDKGTDLKIGLPKGYKFLAAIEENSQGEFFVPNMPTEEVFSMPDKRRMDGVVYSTKPLNYAGNLIDNFKLEIKDGKVVSSEAEVGAEVLKNLLASDEGASRFGEVALVPYHSPISLTSTLFYNTLYDENASCHLALGKAYPTTIENGLNMSKEELDEAGVNDSLIHIDFMIGDETLTIDGVSHSGERIAIFRNGDFVDEVDK